MATIKVACPKCGQKVSGDEHFYGAVVECPICSADIHFPGEKRDRPGYGERAPVPPRSAHPDPPSSSDPDAALQSMRRKDGAADAERSHKAQAVKEALARETPVSSLPAPPADERGEGPLRPSDQAIDLTAASPRGEGPTATTPPAKRQRSGSGGSGGGGGGGGGGEDEDGEIPSAFCGAVSLVGAVLGVVTCVFGAIFCPVAIIFGHLSQAKARRSPVQPAPGQALGAAGLMIGYVWFFVTILILALAVLFKEALGEVVSNLFG